MVLHNTQAVLELAYADAHASDEYMEKDEGDETFFTCPYCREPAFFVDGYWTCAGEC